MSNVNQLTLNRNGLITELVSNVAHQPFGPLKALTLGNGRVRSIDRDPAYRITAINDPVYDVAFSYDANGNILYQSRNVGDLDTGYDALDKLTTATGPLDSYAYSYDRNANRLTDTLNGTSTAYYYEPLSNRLTQAGIDPVILDASGNTTQLRGMTLDYSPDNRLTAANDSTYSYNGIGERVLKTTASKTTVYQYGLQGQLMAELDDGGQIEKAYIYLNGQPFAVLDYATDPTGALYYSHNDHLGTPQGLTNESGAIVWLADYSPFGLAAVNDDPDLDRNSVTFNLRFAGQYFDGESGLHYNYFRDYDPTLGRYIQSDPIGLAGGLNTYGYALQNPLYWSDPFGLWSFSISAYAGIGGGLNISRSGGTFELTGRIGVGVGGGISIDPNGEVSPHSKNTGSGYIARTVTNGSIGLGAGIAGSGVSVTAATGNAVTTKNGGGYTSGSGTAQFGWNAKNGFGVRGELSGSAEFGSYSNWGSPSAVSDDDLRRFCEQNPSAPNCNNDCP